MHPNPRVEEFCQVYARCGDVGRASEACGYPDSARGWQLLNAPGARARVREVLRELGLRVLQDRTVLIGRLEALYERLAIDDPAAAAQVVALQARIAGELVRLRRPSTQPRWPDGRFRAGPAKRVLRAAGGTPQPLDPAAQTGSTATPSAGPQFVDPVQESP